MAIINKILKRKPDLSAAELLQRRLADVATLSHADLLTVAAGDEDAKIRCEAIQRLDYSPTLIEFAFNNSNKSINRSARQRIADCLDTQTLTVEQAVQQLTLEQREQIAACVGNDNIVEQLLADLCEQKSSDQNSLLELAKNNTSARIRQWAAERITDEEQQAQLLKYSKGKDKAVYKLLKTRLDQKQLQQKQDDERNRQIQECRQNIERHSLAPVDPLYKAKLEHLQDVWNSLCEHADQTNQGGVQSLLTTCWQRVQELTTEQDNNVADKNSQDTSLPVDDEKATQQQEELLDGLRRVLQTLVVADEAFDKAHAALNITNIHQRWQTLAHQHAVSTDGLTTYNELNSVIEAELTAISNHHPLSEQVKTVFALPLEADKHLRAQQDKQINRLQQRFTRLQQLVPDLPELKTQVTALQAWLTDRKQQLDAQIQTLKQLGGLIRKSTAALQAGKTGQAQGMRTSIREKCAKLATVPRHLQKQLDALDEQIGKVKDWKDYATLPKKRQLLEQMQALIGVGENPEALATKIKRLQDEWKTLSRGGFGDDEDLWEQFKQAGDKAFEPCAVYFSEQGELRRQNLEKRQRLVTQLKDYYQQEDWEKPDWKNVSKLVQVAFNEWRLYQPVERAANKKVQAEFDAAIDLIRAKLNGEYEHNRQQKQALVEQAQKLIDMEDNRQAIEQAKHLQNRWKLLGSASHKHDQKLWKHFRKHCDAVFEKRKQQSAEFKAELNANKTKVMDLCQELNQLSSGDLDTLLVNRERVQAIRQEFNELGSLPKANVKDLQKRMRDAQDKFEQAIKIKKAEAKAGAWNSLLTAYESVVQAVNDGHLSMATESIFSTSSQWPKNGEKTLQALYDTLTGESLTQGSLEQVPEQRRLLCIRGEILAGLDTPPADQSLRMDYQVKQLAKGFGQSSNQFNNAREAMQALLLEWISLPTLEDGYQELLSRINNCRQKIGV